MVNLADQLTAQIVMNVGCEAGDAGNALFAHHRRVPDAAVVVVVKQVLRPIRLQRFDELRVANHHLQPFRRSDSFMRQYPAGDFVDDIRAIGQQ